MRAYAYIGGRPDRKADRKMSGRNELNESKQEKSGSATGQYEYLLRFWKSRKFIDLPRVGK